jgi:hypothetical protein
MILDNGLNRTHVQRHGELHFQHPRPAGNSRDGLLAPGSAA